MAEMKGFYFSLDAILALIILSAAFLVVIRAEPSVNNFEENSELEMLNLVHQKQYNVFYNNLPKASTPEEFNTGSYNLTSAERKAESGDLGLGYLNEETSSYDLMAYWRMDEDIFGENIIDYSDNENSGEKPSLNYQEDGGLFSTGAYFFNSRYINVSDDETLDPQNRSFSFSAWASIESSGGGDTIIQKYNDIEEEGYRFVVDPSGDLNLILANSSKKYNVTTSGEDLKEGNWHFIAFTFDRKTNKTKLYVDAQEVASSETRFTGDIETSKDLHIAGGPNSASFDGTLDEVILYNQTLTQSEVEDRYFNGEPFRGSYEKLLNNSVKTDWHELQVNASIPSGTDVSATFYYKNSTGDIQETKIIDLQEGFRNYSINETDTEDATIKFNGSSDSVGKTWEIHSYKVFEKSRMATKEFNGTVLKKIMAEYREGGEQEAICDRFLDFGREYSLIISNATESNRICGEKVDAEEISARRIPVRDSIKSDLRGPKTAKMVIED